MNTDEPPNTYKVVTMDERVVRDFGYQIAHDYARLCGTFYPQRTEKTIEESARASYRRYWEAPDEGL